LILSLLGVGLAEVVAAWIVGVFIGLGLTAWFDSGDSHRHTTAVGWLAWGASAALAGIIYLVTDAGTLVIDADDENIEIAVRPLVHESHEGNKHSLAWQFRIGDTITGSTVTRLRSGAYLVDLKGKENEYELSQDRFILKRGGKVVVKVSRRDDMVRMVAPRPDSSTSKLATTPRVDEGKTTEPSRTPIPVPGVVWRLIPAGEFEMGSSEADARRLLPDEDWFFAGFVPSRRGAELPRRRVKITRPFHMSAHEVTVGQFREFIYATAHVTTAEKRGDGYGWREGVWAGGREFNWKNPGFDQSDKHPVCNVSWEDAAAYCRWLSQREGKICRLPTEAEWEYACRAGTTTLFSTGDDPDSLQGAANLADASLQRKHPHVNWGVAWDDGFATTAPVGSFQPNAFGLYDMHGNAWEWCQDVYDYEGYEKSDVVDPLRTGVAGAHVFRGGGFDNWPGFLRAADRYSSHSPEIRTEWGGFRVVRETERPQVGR
jgi:formylglycine-generating enzyme required for sulfatase activity